MQEQIALEQDDANSEERDQLRQSGTKNSLVLGISAVKSIAIAASKRSGCITSHRIASLHTKPSGNEDDCFRSSAAVGLSALSSH